MTADGLVKAEAPGDAAIVVTYQRKVRRPAPRHSLRPARRSPAKNDANNRIDELVYRKLKAMGVPPSDLATDEVFLRRVYLDVIGILPTAAEARAFLAKPDRAALIDSLLARDEFNDFWSLKWGDLLRIKSEYPVRVWPKAVAVYYQWVHDSLAANKPYDQFARELLTATGSNFRVGPANFVRAVPDQGCAHARRDHRAGLHGRAHRLRPLPCPPPRKLERPTTISALGAFFARVNYKGTQEWKEEIVYPDFRQTLARTRARAPSWKPACPAPPRLPRSAPRKIRAASSPPG